MSLRTNSRRGEFPGRVIAALFILMLSAYPGHAVSQLRSSIGHRSVPPDSSRLVIDRVKRLVLECEMALYSPSGGQQQRQHTLDEAAGTIGELEIVLKNKNNVLQHAG